MTLIGLQTQEFLAAFYTVRLTHQRLRERPGESGTKAAEAAAKKGRVWILDEEFVRPLEVQTGITDVAVTEITGGDVKEQMGVVVGNPR